MIKKYVKKPIVVEAMLYTGTKESFKKARDFMGSMVIPDRTLLLKTSLYAQTPEGQVYVCKGDYLIKDSGGDFWNCVPDIFKAEYSEVLGETE